MMVAEGKIRSLSKQFLKGKDKRMKNSNVKTGALGNKAGVIKSGSDIGKTGNHSTVVKTGPDGDLRSKG